MSRTKGLLALSGNFEPQIAAPFDARHIVGLASDLTLPTTWQAKDNTVYTYIGMRVTVTNDPSPANNGVYWLIADDYTQNANWVKLGEGGSGQTEIYVQATAPVGATEGNIWYNTTTEDVFIYREISPGVLAWRPFIVGDTNSDTIDGGVY